MISGLISLSRAGPSPHFHHARTEVLDQYVGIRNQSAQNVWPAGLLKLRVIVRLLRAMTLYHKPCPSWFQPWVRAGSLCGCSILITSAPKSPNSIPVIGAAYTVLTSNTRVPVNGSLDLLRPPTQSCRFGHVLPVGAFRK